MFQPDTFVVVADGQQARFYAAEADLSELRELRHLSNRHHGGEHRSHKGGGHDAHHHPEEERFAREVGQEVDDAMRETTWRDLVLVAPPRFLGDLRDHLPQGASKRVRASIARDLTAETGNKLAKHLRDLLADQHLDAKH